MSRLSEVSQAKQTWVSIWIVVVKSLPKQFVPFPVEQSPVLGHACVSGIVIVQGLGRSPFLRGEKQSISA